MRALAKCLLQFFRGSVLTRYLALVTPVMTSQRGSSAALLEQRAATHVKDGFFLKKKFLDVAPPNCQIPHLRDAEINGNKSRVTSRTDGRRPLEERARRREEKRRVVTALVPIPSDCDLPPCLSKRRDGGGGGGKANQYCHSQLQIKHRSLLRPPSFLSVIFVFFPEPLNPQTRRNRLSARSAD